MKKIYFLLLIGMVFSCSNESETNAEEMMTTPVLVTSAETFQAGGSLGILTYNYSGSKLLNIVHGNGNQIQNYTYTGDLITKIEIINDGNLIVEIEFDYNVNDKLIHYYQIGHGAVYGQDEIINIDYSYNTNNTISYVKSIALDSGTPDQYSGTIYMTNGLVTMVQNTSIQGLQETYTYDTKNSPFKNITGFDKLIFEDNNLLFYLPFHNVMLKQVVTDFSIHDINYTYEYNANDYPIKRIREESNDYYLPEVTTEYTYNQ